MHWILVLFVVLQASGKDKPEHPYAKAKVGEWVAYKRQVEGTAQPTVIKETVTTRAGNVVTLSRTVKIGQLQMPALELKHELNKPYDWFDEYRTQGANPDIKKLGEGTEKITLNGKAYDCTWEQRQFTFPGESSSIIIVKIWQCKDLPLGGFVKSEAVSSGRKTTKEVTGFGSKP